MLKDEAHRIQLIVGGNIINFPGDITTPTETFRTAKLIFNGFV